MGVEIRTVDAADGDMRLDRWFRREFPNLGHGRLEKLLRTGQVRVDGRRVKASERLQPGASVRVPPLGDQTPLPTRKPLPNRKQMAEAAKTLRQCILFQDDHILLLNKPAGLAVQGGSKTETHVDAALDALADKGGERPRLVHRLDKDTSGLLLIAKTRKAAAKLTAAFKAGQVSKEYWAVCADHPGREAGLIDLPLAKRRSAGGEKMVGDAEAGKRAVTDMRLVTSAGEKLCWLALRPETGRTHQLRAHCAAIDCPILGDGKYGGSDAFPTGGHRIQNLHLHARCLAFDHPATGRSVEFEADLPPHMADTFAAFGFELTDYQPTVWDEI